MIIQVVWGGLTEKRTIGVSFQKLEGVFGFINKPELKSIRLLWIEFFFMKPKEVVLDKFIKFFLKAIE